MIDEHKTFKGFTYVSDNLDRKEYFSVANVGKLIAKIHLSWKKSFSMGTVIPHKLKNCTYCKKEVLFDTCDKLVSQKKELSANLNEMKRQASNEFDHMLPKYITTWIITSLTEFDVYLEFEKYIVLYETKTKPIGMCIDIPIVNSKPIGSPFR